MSTPPFPPANQPPGRPISPQPGFGQPGAHVPGGFSPAGGGIAPPPWQSGGSPPPSGLAPPPQTPPSKSKTPLIIGALVVVAILVVVGVFVLGGDSGDGDIRSAEAARGLESVLRDGSYDDTGIEELRDCPLGDIEDLTAAVGTVLDLDEAVSDGDVLSSLSEEGEFPGLVACQVYADDDIRDGPGGLYFEAILDPPRRYEAFIEDLNGDSTTFEFDDSVDYQGGEVFLFCGEANDDSGFTGCDADWVNVDDNIALNVFLSGDDVDSGDAFTALKSVIKTMAANLAEFDTES